MLGTAMSGSQDRDVLSFLAEWFDPLPQITKQYLLKYFVETNEAEMVALKTRRLFLKRSPCPKHFTAKDFALGNKVILYGRDLRIVSYADKSTEAALVPQAESAAFLISPGTHSAVGKIMDEIITASGGVLTKLRTASLGRKEAVEAARCLGFEGHAARGLAESLERGVGSSHSVVFGVVRGSNAEALTTKTCESLRSRFASGEAKCGVWCTGSGKNAQELEQLFAAGGPVTRGNTTATFDSCTCCVIKPHAVKAGNSGKIIDRILSEGYEVTAMEMFRLNHTQAEEFLAVYQGVVPNFSDAVDEMTTGSCLAMEVRGEDVVPRFRETAGPWDVDMAKELRPKSIRGTFGDTGARTGVHCTDLAEDGPAESRYFFELMQASSTR